MQQSCRRAAISRRCEPHEIVAVERSVGKVRSESLEDFSLYTVVVYSRWLFGSKSMCVPYSVYRRWIFVLELTLAWFKYQVREGSSACFGT